MSEPIPHFRKASETLTQLSHNRLLPQQIEDGVTYGDITPNRLVMTSMGDRRRALITPWYHAFPYDNRLSDRIEWAGAYRRPFVEAAIAYSSSRNCAALTLRLCYMPNADVPAIQEAHMTFDVGDYNGEIDFMEDVVDAIADSHSNGLAIAQQSGIVHATPDRLKKGRWGISIPEEPAFVIDSIHSSVTSELFFQR